MIGTLLALGAGWLIWAGSASLADILKWPTLLPLVRLGAVVVGVTALDYAFAVLRPLLDERTAGGASEGAVK
jgi:hypothetical protein